MKSTDDKSWQSLEKKVRQIAEIHFGYPARAQDIAGVRCDCVIDLDDGEVVIIEISKQKDIIKLRKDIIKFNTIRPHFIGKNIKPKCFFVTEGVPTPALIQAGKEQYVEVYSIMQFINLFSGYHNYYNQRRTKPFGSAIDMYSGEPDVKQFIGVEYYSSSGETFGVEKICSELSQGTHIVLLGDYGTGKSRCVKEVFEYLYELSKETIQHPIAINLRDNWGLDNASELLTRHFTKMGLENNLSNVLKIAFSKITIYLLDGFDEIGAQAWSDNPSELIKIRKQSLVGVKDLISQVEGGLLITGREHYFNCDEELISCLGLGAKKLLFLYCNKELSSEQFAELTGYDTKMLPIWVPKKPLIGTIIRDIPNAAVEEMFSSSTGQIDFWDMLITNLCEREAKINPILDASVIRALYSRIGRLSRTTRNELGPISIKDINVAFEFVTGYPPTDESAVILQRLPGLSRIGAESLDRQFIDIYILDGLRAEDIELSFSNGDSSILNERWIHPIEDFGIHYLATRINVLKQQNAVIAYIKRYYNSLNKIFISDILSALMVASEDKIDFSGIVFSGGKFHNFSCDDLSIDNITFDDCTFSSIHITPISQKNFLIKKSYFYNVSGVTSPSSFPLWVVDCACENFQNTNTLVEIKNIGLSLSQTFLLSSLRKLFFQPGAGRKEESMYKGYGDNASKKVCEKIINLLIKEKFCQRFKGATGDLFIPDRGKTARAKAIICQLKTSNDALWTDASKIR